MVDIILTEEERTQCSLQTLDLIAKAAIAGAVGYVLWHAFVKEGIARSDFPSRFGKKISARLSKRFGFGGE
jgi:hypothetical protein